MLTRVPALSLASFPRLYSAFGASAALGLAHIGRRSLAALAAKYARNPLNRCRLVFIRCHANILALRCAQVNNFAIDYLSA